MKYKAVTALNPQNTARRAGFLLFEALVAILAASIALISIMQCMGNALRAAKVTGEYFKASLLALNRMSLLEKEDTIKAGTESGRFAGGDDPDGMFSWEEEAVPVSSASVFGGEELPVCNVTVKVRWKGAKGERSLKISTYIPKYEESSPER